MPGGQFGELPSPARVRARVRERFARARVRRTGAQGNKAPLCWGKRAHFVIAPKGRQSEEHGRAGAWVVGALAAVIRRVNEPRIPSHLSRAGECQVILPKRFKYKASVK
ncbi:hypothetical protein DP115_32825 [Brasilonema octagenarum UFV-OR1]|uniref:Uncharacterized protein n=1 Tax=Brasilonema octagenarum UFV-OR1 TaxID=417115 RepID=A0ABX1MFA6_9CYAN|nr:hypothetical protein [Brasilonema octagenarum UFV-OR1]